MHWSYGCMAEPGDRYICREYKRLVEVTMDRMPWIDWWERLQELAEEEGYILGEAAKYREMWLDGKSPKATLEELEE